MRRLKQKESLVAEVNDKGEVRVEDQFVGRLEGFRFRLDPSAGADEAKTLRMAAMQALGPAFNLRADKFYNAPDTEIDVTEQGGLMWGEHAVGKLVAGTDTLSPQIEVFVDEEAGGDVAEKVRRRLSHWLDRKIAALFEPLIALRDDATLTGMARGIAFRIVEEMGVVPRSQIAKDVKELDQDQRGLLRKHGVRFGQFTVFQPAMLKPAPTRLRIVLWGLAAKLDEFPEAPPPGLVTVPAIKDAPQGYYAKAGYRLSGERAIRIDMLERLADMIRTQDTRAGFEATADMLSISGLTLEQFADLMGGMGYKAEKGTRPKVRQPVEAAPSDESASDAPQDAGAEIQAADGAPTAPASETAEADAPVDEVIGADAAPMTPEPMDAPDEADPARAGDLPDQQPAAPALAAEEELTVTDPAAEAPEDEVFYIFTWAPRRRPADQGRQGQGERPGGKPQGFKGKKGKKPRGPKPQQNFSARPKRPEKAIDPDNPFAALAALKEKG